MRFCYVLGALAAAVALAGCSGSKTESTASGPVSGPGPNPAPQAYSAAPGTTIGLEVGQSAPQIEGVDADGNNFKLSDYRGKVVVIDFWANW